MAYSKILITGATGTTGGAIARQLAAAGVAARAVVRNPAKLVETSPSTIAYVAGDLGDRASLTAAMQGIDAVYLNIVPGAGALAQIENAVAAAQDAGVTSIVKLSAMNAAPDASSAIIRMHAAADDLVGESGLGFTILRAYSFFQNILGQLDGIKADGRFYLPLGDARQSLIDVEDLAATAISLLTVSEHRGRSYELTGPESLSFADVAAALSDAAGRPVAYVPISRSQFEDTLRGAGTPEAAASNVGELFQAFASGDYAEVMPDLMSIIGRAPRRFDQFAQTLFA